MTKAGWAWVVFGVLIAFAVGYALSKIVAAYEKRGKIAGALDIVSGLEKLEVI